MKIYHYTSIGALALILHSKKIRFTRLDLLDDIQEVDGFPAEFKSRFFVSSWTEDGTENLALWSLYTNMKGVRIELDQKFYEEHLITNGDHGYWGYTKDTYTPLPLDEIRTDDYLIGNPFWLEDGFYGKVEYQDTFSSRKGEHVIETKKTIGINNPINLVKFKDPIWAFQNESRFYLFIRPLPPISMFNGNRIEQMKNLNNTQLVDKGSFQLINSLRSIDVKVKKEVLERIVVRMHPNCSQADKIIVDSLLREYSTSGSVEHSELDEKYRGKKLS